MHVPHRVKITWAKFWMLFSGPGLFGRLACGLASWSVPPHHGRYLLRNLNPKGFFAPSSRLSHAEFSAGQQVFLGKRVIIYQNGGGGPVHLGDDVLLTDDVVLETGYGARIAIGNNSRCQTGCHLSAYKADILIGDNVGLAPGCRLLSSNHGRSASGHSELVSKGPIRIEDGAWLGADVKVLSGVTIGAGAVVATGSVVTKDVPAGMIAAGVPARVIKARAEMT